MATADFERRRMDVLRIASTRAQDAQDIVALAEKMEAFVSGEQATPPCADRVLCFVELSTKPIIAADLAIALEMLAGNLRRSPDTPCSGVRAEARSGVLRIEALGRDS